MRRSAAPSQLGLPFKKPRFQAPLKSACSQKTEENSEIEATNKSRSISDVLKLVQDPSKSATDNKTTSSKAFSTPSKSSTNKGSCTYENIENEVNFALQDEAKIKDQLNKNESETQISTKVENETETQVPINTHSRSEQVKKLKARSFQAPLSSKKQFDACQTQSNEKTDLGEPETIYFNVIWCKLSKKKHKKWEGDAILLVNGRTVTMLDLDGKVIGKGSGYKSSELSQLGEGNTLVIGGKEIEVMSSLSQQEFKSGKCFNTGTCAEDFQSKPMKNQLTTGGNKPFLKPMKAGNELNSPQSVTSQAPVEVKPRHNPEAPNALVLPRPSKSHMWENNASRQPVVDVVVDPYLSQHLRSHQREGVTFLYECVMGYKPYMGQGAILADEMGLGKTLQCISLVWTLLRQGPYGGKPVVKKVLIVTPGSLVKNWLKEFKKWLGSERIKVFAVASDNKVEEFVNLPHHPVCIISYEMLVRTIDTIQKLPFDLVVCDEGHRLKNSTIKTTSFLNSLSTRRRIVLTGTPVQNDLQELYSIVNFCNPGILGSQAAFRRVYEDCITSSHQSGASTDVLMLGQERAAELNRITAMFILRRTSDVNNKYLPPKVEMVLFCKPSTLQLALYKQLIGSAVLRSCFVSHDMGQHLMCISALKKLCNHPALLYNNAVQAGTSGSHGSDSCEKNIAENEQTLYKDLLQSFEDRFNPHTPVSVDSGKLQVVETMLECLHNTSPVERVVLVSNYTQTLDILESLCENKSYKFVRLDGKTPTDKRQSIVERFNSKYSQDFVFLLSCKAGGVGLNLVGASRLILYDVDWNPANDLQAMARVWRDGQRKTVYIYRLLTTGTIEEKIYQRQISKQSLSGVVVDARGTSAQNCFSPDELRDLFTLQENTESSTHDLLGCRNCDESGSDVPGSILSRACQLQKKSISKKNLSMDQLLEWKHFSAHNIDMSTLDPVLSQQKLDEISFLFWNESNKKSIHVDTDCDKNTERNSM